mmetsp:Transcript_19391/g.42353  ORF Transcript_19391/g.42353 Transcript_19391/m.42353 type:complete len:276 (-) Transcript_19391:106-933(-)|eukprot:CAMPEP_0170607730 /NCGR_PEP_ID=MMETSP0224-20130122/21208_1 /TAXON_ID=285029 /ORGANISM="Togula jolla, Strain CCCM 725" /LENGTH=275 /DNA_ID=CAMNT_0010932911 /DNA_START=75 /DNA_END=902 /DNA_ORIENTATION=+
MASFWQSLRDELTNTVEEVRTKGAVGAFRDAALDTRDIVTDTGGWLWNGVKDLAGEVATPACPVVRACSDAEVGDEGQLEVPGGGGPSVEILALDKVSMPTRARVRRNDTGEEVVAILLKPEDAWPPATASDPRGMPSILPTPVTDTAAWFVDELRNQVRDTAQDFREKGAVGAFKDAALDAVDMVGNVAGVAVSGAKSFQTWPADTASAPTPAGPGASSSSRSTAGTSLPKSTAASSPETSTGDNAASAKQPEPSEDAAETGAPSQTLEEELID